MAFFMVMFALSRVDSEKFKQLAGSLTSAFSNPAGGLINIGVGDDGRLAIIPRQPRDNGTPDDETGPYRDLKRAKKEFEQLIKESGLEDSLAVATNAEGDRLVVTLSDSLLFLPGSADLTPQAEQLINEVGDILVKAGKAVRIEGHTDNVPMKSGRYESNWHLSAARATNVLVYLVEDYGIAPELLSAGGYGEYRPIASNNSLEGRGKNRRVEFVILDKPEE